MLNQPSESRELRPSRRFRCGVLRRRKNSPAAAPETGRRWRQWQRRTCRAACRPRSPPPSKKIRIGRNSRNRRPGNLGSMWYGGGILFNERYRRRRRPCSFQAQSAPASVPPDPSRPGGRTIPSRCDRVRPAPWAMGLIENEGMRKKFVLKCVEITLRMSVIIVPKRRVPPVISL